VLAVGTFLKLAGLGSSRNQSWARYIAFEPADEFKTVDLFWYRANAGRGSNAGSNAGNYCHGSDIASPEVPVLNPSHRSHLFPLSEKCISNPMDRIIEFYHQAENDLAVLDVYVARQGIDMTLPCLCGFSGDQMDVSSGPAPD
jgi:hypothetical protein